MNTLRKTPKHARDTDVSLGASLGRRSSEKLLGRCLVGDVFYFALRCLSGMLSGENFPREPPREASQSKIEYISPITASQDLL